MRELVREQAAPILRVRVVVGAPEHDVRPGGEGERIDGIGGRYARLFTMQASAYTGEPVDLAELDPDGEQRPLDGDGEVRGGPVRFERAR